MFYNPSDKTIWDIGKIFEFHDVLTGDINIEDESIKFIICEYEDIDDKLLIEYQFRVFKMCHCIAKCKIPWNLLPSQMKRK